MNTLRLACQRNLYQIRQFHKCIVQQQEAAAAAATATTTATTKPSDSATVSTKEEPVVSSKIEQIADQIVSLNLIEVAQLSDILKKRLNLPDAPVMPMGGFVAAAAKGQDEEEESQTVVQTAFTVKLTGFDDKQKVALIKELKTILPDCNLVQAKKFVESAPAVIKSDLTKEESDNLVEAITKVGGKVEVV